MNRFFVFGFFFHDDSCQAHLLLHECSFLHCDEIDGIEAIHSCAISGCNERRDFPMKIPEAIWKRLCIARYNKRECEGGCPFSAQCEYHRMRERILNAGIVICNQDMLTAHLMRMKAGTPPVLNPNIGIVVVDEAHNLESRVRSMDTQQISAAKVKQMLSNAVNSMKSRMFGFMDAYGVAVRSSVDALFSNAQMQVVRQMGSGADSQDTERFFCEDTDGGFQLVKEMADAVLKAANAYYVSLLPCWLLYRRLVVYSSVSCSSGGNVMTSSRSSRRERSISVSPRRCFANG